MGADLGKALKGFNGSVQGSEESAVSTAAESKNSPDNATADLKDKA